MIPAPQMDPAGPTGDGSTTRGRTSMNLREAVRRGDGSAIAYIYEHFYPLAVQWARRFAVKDGSTSAEDLVSEAMLILTKAFENLKHNFKDDRKRWTPVVVRWLRTTITYLASSERRRATPAQLTVVQGDDGDSVPADVAILDTSTAVPERAARREIDDRIGQVLATLSPEDRDIVLLRTFHGLTFREIGAKFSKPLDTVYGRFQNAIKRLRATVPGAVFDDFAEE